MGMSKHDRIIGDLVNALDAIVRELGVTTPRLAYIEGVAEQAIKNAHAQQERNRDGYLVVKAGPPAAIDDGGAAFPAPVKPDRTYARGDHVIYEFRHGVKQETGMSLRAYIATAVVSAFGSADMTDSENLHRDRATAAVKQADALITALRGGSDGN